jgi:type II secretion system protein C
MIAEMWQPQKLVLEWRGRAPRWTAVFLAGLIVVDGAHSAWMLRSSAGPRIPVGPVVLATRRIGIDVQSVLNAHLFGVAPVGIAAGNADAANASETGVALALKGIIASRDPGNGYAILGEEGQPTHAYYTGASLIGLSGARLYQVFTDHVIVDFSGRLETLQLPRHLLPGLVPPGQSAPVTVANVAPVPSAAEANPDDGTQPTPAQNLFSYMDAEQNSAGGKADGMVIHPSKLLQRQYGFGDGDTLTSINGVQITDPYALADALKTPNKSLSVTYIHDGVQQTKTLQLND